MTRSTRIGGGDAPADATSAPAREPLRLRFTFRFLMILAVTGLAIGSCAVVYGLANIRTRSDQALDAWYSYVDRASDKERALRAFVEQIGAGGMIDDLKSYVMSGEETFAPQIYAHSGAALSALARYAETDVSEEEGAALAVLDAMVRAYQARVAVIGNLHRAGASVAEIDGQVRIDDTAAESAIATLYGHVLSVRASAREDGLKPEIIFDLRRALGYRGVAHAYKNFILRNEEPDRSRALAAITKARDAITRYRAHDLGDDERDALATLDLALDDYEEALAGGTIDRLRAQGLDPAEIDARTRAAAAPMVGALSVLDRAAAREERAARSQLFRALGFVAAAAGRTAEIVVLGAILMTVGSIWLLGFRVVLRVRRLTSATRELAAGDTHTEIPFTKERDELGEMSRALLVFRDNMESNATLARELAESSRLASLGALVAGMAHELNTPIGNALSVSTALGESLGRFSAEVDSGQLRKTTLSEFVARATDATALLERNLFRASEQIGSFKQLAVDQTGDQRRSFELDKVLRDVVESMHPSVRRHSCAITLEAESGVAMDGYPGALTQVVCNLVENALKHGLADTRSGSIHITARRLDKAAAEVTVTDNGGGIPAELMPRIFDAFFTTRAGAGGSGLGLHIVNTLVSGPLGGEVHVDPRPGEGARFTIIMPIVAPERASAEDTEDERVYYAAA